MGKPPTPEPPSPAIPDRVNLGLIVETPVLHQLALPTALQTTVRSSRLAGPREGTTKLTYDAMRLLSVKHWVGGGSEKREEFFYVPGDPRERIERLTKLVVSEEQLARAATDRAERKVLTARVDAAREKLRAAQQDALRGAPPMQLQRATFVETSPGSVGVSGETTYVYEGGEIVSSKSITRTDESPARVDELARSYRYDALGRLASVTAAGMVTRYTYDPFGRCVLVLLEYASPDGSFCASNKTVFAFAPPGPGPVPANALLLSTTVARSGPSAAIEPPPPPEPPAIPDVTTVDGLFVYA